MTTTPTTPSLLPTWVVTWEAFIKAHERLILILAAAGVITFGIVVIKNGVHKYLDNKHIEAQTLINSQIATTEQKSAALESQIAQMQTQYQQLTQTLTAAIAAQKQVVIVQQKKDDAMSPTDLSQRWADLIKAPAGNITPQANGSLTVSNEASHATVNQLETIPWLESTNVALGKELAACDALNGEKDKDIDAQKALVTDEKNGRAADAVVANDKIRKSFWKGFKFGAIAGFVGGLFALHKI